MCVQTQTTSMSIPGLGGVGPVKLVVAVVLLLSLAVGGGFALGIFGAPSVADVQNSFGEVNETTTEIETNMTVENDNPVGASFGGVTVEYAVTMNEIPMAEGTREGVELERGNNTMAFSTSMRNERIPDWWVSHLRNGERTTVRIFADVHSSTLDRTFDAPAVEREVETDLLSALNSTETREVNADHPLVSDPVLYVNETSAEWGEVTDERSEIRMEFVLYNPKSHPVALTEIGYDIRMNDVAVGEGATERSVVIPARSTKTVTATTTIRNDRLDEWWVTHLQRNQTTAFESDFYLRADLGAVGGGEVRLPLDTMKTTIETDIFGEREADGEPNGTDDDQATADGATESDGGATPAPTETPTPDPATEAPTESPTEDDGLFSRVASESNI